MSSMNSSEKCKLFTSFCPPGLNYFQHVIMLVPSQNIVSSGIITLNASCSFLEEYLHSVVGVYKTLLRHAHIDYFIQKRLLSCSHMYSYIRNGGVNERFAHFVVPFYYLILTKRMSAVARVLRRSLAPSAGQIVLATALFIFLRDVCIVNTCESYFTGF